MDDADPQEYKETQSNNAMDEEEESYGQEDDDADQQQQDDDDRKPAASRGPRVIRRGPKHSREAITSLSVSRRTKLTPAQYSDLLSSLEHLITAGCKRKREWERRQEFRETQEQVLELEDCFPWTYNNVEDVDDGLNQETEDNDKDSQSEQEAYTAPSQQQKRRTKEILTEDIRIYGDVGGVRKDGFGKGPWPNQKQYRKIDLNLAMNNSDRNWAIEHGDQIHPLAFATARLSQSNKPKTKDEVEVINKNNLQAFTTDTSLSPEEVPRALLLRCWERAVHAASQTVPVHVDESGKLEGGVAGKEKPKSKSGKMNGDDKPSSELFGGNVLGLGEEVDDGPIIPKEAPVKEPVYVIEQRGTDKDRTATRLKCKSLGISLNNPDLPPGLPDGACPACTRSFETSEALRQHYYGGPQNRGCCWNRIPEAQTEKIAQVMELHVKKQMDGFLGLIMACAEARVIEPPDGQKENKVRRLLNWHDILKFAEKTIQSSYCIEASTADPHNGLHPIFETLQHKSGGVQLVLNPTVLENVRQRLVDRYAQLPP